MFRDGERPERGPAPPEPAPARARAVAHDRGAPRLERTVVALGARTEVLAAHLERLEGRLDRLQVDVREVDVRARRDTR